MPSAPTVVIPTFQARQLLADALESLAAQTVPVRVVVVDNASTDGTAELVRERFPDVTLVRSERNLGFGRAVNLGAARADAETAAIVLVNNDTVCAPDFVERLLEPLADPEIGMVAGVLLQQASRDLVDSAGIELDVTLRSWDLLWNRSVTALAAAPDPVGPCGGAAAYRAEAFRAASGFDEAFFAYWEDVDLALRLRAAGWGCALAHAARAVHWHGATLGSSSPAQRRLEAFGRAYVLAKFSVRRAGPRTRLGVIVLDWPVLLVHLLVRRELGPIRARLRGTRAGRRAEQFPAPLELATVTFRTALRRQLDLLRLRFSGTLPAHFDESGPRTQPR